MEKCPCVTMTLPVQFLNTPLWSFKIRFFYTTGVYRELFVLISIKKTTTTASDTNSTAATTAAGRIVTYNIWVTRLVDPLFLYAAMKNTAVRVDTFFLFGFIL